MNRQLPDDLYLFGFSQRGTKIEPAKLDDLRELIRREFRSTYRISTSRTSYGLKHIAERLLGRYVSNGEFIAAMILEGFSYRKAGESPNAYFNISEKQANELHLKSIIHDRY